jgi:hypothetical protein
MYSFTEYTEGSGVSSQIDTIPSFVGSTYKLENSSLAWFYTSPINNRFVYSDLKEEITQQSSFQKEDSVVLRAGGIGWAPHNPYGDFNWGITLVGLSMELTSRNYKHDIQDPTATTQRVEKIAKEEFDIQALNLSLILGIQYKLDDNWKMGIKYQAPSYNLSTNVNFYADQQEIKHNNSNQVEWLSLLMSAESQDGKFTIADSINLAFSYEEDRWLHEIVFSFNNNANAFSDFSIEPEIQYTVGNSAGTPPTNGSLGKVDFSSDEEPKNAIVNINYGFIYHNNDSTQLGFGFFTDFAPEKDDAGIDIFGVTTGAKIKSKYGYNYLGFMYRKGFDRGNNTREVNGVDTPVEIELQAFSMSLSSTVFY